MTSLFTKKSPLAVSFTLNVKTFPMPLKTCWIMALALFLSRQMLVIRISEQAYPSPVQKHSTCPSFCFTVFPEQAIPFHRNNVNYAISHVTQINGKSGHIRELLILIPVFLKFLLKYMSSLSTGLHFLSLLFVQAKNSLQMKL